MNRYLDPMESYTDFTRAEGLYRRAQLSFNQILATGDSVQIDAAEADLECARQTYLQAKAALPTPAKQEAS